MEEEGLRFAIEFLRRMAAEAERLRAPVETLSARTLYIAAEALEAELAAMLEGTGEYNVV